MQSLEKLYCVAFFMAAIALLGGLCLDFNARLSAANEEIKLADERTECLVRELDMVKKDYWASEEKLQRLEASNANKK